MRQHSANATRRAWPMCCGAHTVPGLGVGQLSLAAWLRFRLTPPRKRTNACGKAPCREDGRLVQHAVSAAKTTRMARAMRNNRVVQRLLALWERHSLRILDAENDAPVFRPDLGAAAIDAPMCGLWERCNAQASRARASQHPETLFGPLRRLQSEFGDANGFRNRKAEDPSKPRSRALRVTSRPRGERRSAPSPRGY